MRALATLRSHTVTVLVTIGAVAVVVGAAVVATGSGPPSVAFREPGHWVYNRIERAAFQVDGGTRRVDARVDVPSSAGDPLMVLQGHREGFVVARDSVSPFARAALTVGAPARTARDEVPVGVEAAGGPYLVYPQAGTIVRLAEPRTSVEVGGPVGAPVRGADGTVWVHRPDTGEVCGLRSGAVTLDCAARTAPGAAGALTVVDGRPAWLDPAAGTLADLAREASTPISLGDVAGPLLVAESAAAGRLPVVVPDRSALVLADLAGGTPAVVDLGPGRWAPPAAAGTAVTVVDQDTGRLRTFDAAGAPRGDAELAPGATGPVVGGDGRLYVDDPQGTTTAVVAGDGSVSTVPTTGVGPGTIARAATAIRADAPAGPARSEEQAATLPRAPTGLSVKRQGDVLTVSWRAPAGTVGHYTVVLNRGVATTTTATSTTLRSPAGHPVRVAVSATNAAGTGPLSPVVTAAAAVARPGAPTGLTLAADGGPHPYAFAPSWRAPDLGGGTLVRYEVSWTSATGTKTTKTTTGTSLPPVAGDPCAAPYTVAVRAVTRTPAGRVLTGPPATSSAPAPPGGSCAVRMTLAAAANGDDAITVTATDGGGATGPCVLSVDGTVRWSGTCGDRARTRIPIGGLDPDTRYIVVLTARNPDGSTTRTDPVSVTTD